MVDEYSTDKSLSLKYLYVEVQLERFFLNSTINGMETGLKVSMTIP